MPCLLRVTQPGPLVQYLDPGPDPYLWCVVGTTTVVSVTCEIYPYGGATSVTRATAQVRDPFGNVTALTLTSSAGPGGSLVIQFSLGGPSDGAMAAQWNAVDVTPQDNLGSQPQTVTFYFYKCNGAAPPCCTPCPPAPATSTTPPPPPPPMRKPPAPEKKHPRKGR